MNSRCQASVKIREELESPLCLLVSFFTRSLLSSADFARNSKAKTYSTMWTVMNLFFDSWMGRPVDLSIPRVRFEAGGSSDMNEFYLSVRHVYTGITKGEFLTMYNQRWKSKLTVLTQVQETY